MSKACLITLFLFGFLSQNVYAKKPKPGVNAPFFNYLAPTKWGELGANYKLCSTGTKQSPINIDTKKITINKELPPLKVVYEITNATLRTDGRAAQLVIRGKSGVLIGGKTHKLVDLRWHTPSEHTIDGKTFVAELHQVFVTVNDKPDVIPDIAIIATVYLIGAPDPLVAAIEPEMTKMAKEMSVDNDETKGYVYQQQITSAKLGSGGELLSKIPTQTYMAYPGSLTTPPCLEDITWFLTNPQTMTLEQAKLINELQSKSNKANSRPTQPLNGRLIQSKAGQ